MRLLTVREAAERLGAPPVTIRLWCRQGRLAQAQRVGRDWVIPEEALQTFRRPARPWRRERDGQGN